MNRTQTRQYNRAARKQLKLRGLIRNVGEHGQVIGVPLAPQKHTAVTRQYVYKNDERYYTRKSDGKRMSRGPRRINVTKSRTVTGYVTGPIRNAA